MWGVFRGEEVGPIEGPTFLLLALRYPERGSQPVGSFVTKVSLAPLKVVSKAPAVVG
jgi:hypothetical protein